MDFTPFLNLFEQEVETVKRTEAILTKIIFWINCLALTVWATNKMGYTIDYQFPIKIYGLLRLIGEQHFTLGLTIYLAIHFSIQRICNALAKLSLLLYKLLYFKRESSRVARVVATPAIFEGVLLGEVALEGENLNRRKEKSERNGLHQKNRSEMALTVALVYDLIVSNNYPNAHFTFGTIILWSYVIISLWERGKSNFIIFITDQWIPSINKFSQTTTTTTTSHHG